MTNNNNSLIDFSNFSLPPTSDKNPFGGEDKKEPRRKNHVWLNVGVAVEVEGKQVLLALPLGIPCDGLEAQPIPKDKDGKNPGFKMQRIAEAKLVEQLKAAIATLKPGDRVMLRNFSAELYHIEPREELANQDLSSNPYMSALNSAFTPVNSDKKTE